MPAILRQISKTAIAGGLARLLTIVIPFAVVRVYGLGPVTDAYFLAAAVVLFWTTSMAPVLETGIVAELGRDGAPGWRTVGRIGGRFSLLAAGVALAVFAVFALAPAAGIEAGMAARARGIFLEFSPLLLLVVWSSLLAGWLNLHRHFAHAAISPAFIGLGALSSMYLLGPRLGIEALILGYLLGEALRLAYLGGAIVSTGTGGRGAAQVGSAPAAQRSPLAGMGAQWASLVLLTLNPVVDRVIAGRLPAGNIAVLEVVERLCLIPTGVMVWAVLPVLTTHLAQLAPEPHGLRRELARIMLWTFVTGAAIAGALALVHRPLLSLVVAGSGAAWPDDGNAAFLALAAAIPFHAATLVLWRAAAVLRRPAGFFIVLGVAAFCLNLVLDLVAVAYWALPGIALATFLTYFSSCLLLWVLGIRPRD